MFRTPTHPPSAALPLRPSGGGATSATQAESRLRTLSSATSDGATVSVAANAAATQIELIEAAAAAGQGGGGGQCSGVGFPRSTLSISHVTSANSSGDAFINISSHRLTNRMVTHRRLAAQLQQVIEHDSPR
jgi:hypothetical protein